MNEKWTACQRIPAQFYPELAEDAKCIVREELFHKLQEVCSEGEFFSFRYGIRTQSPPLEFRHSYLDAPKYMDIIGDLEVQSKECIDISTDKCLSKSFWHKFKNWIWRY